MNTVSALSLGWAFVLAALSSGPFSGQVGAFRAAGEAEGRGQVAALGNSIRVQPRRQPKVPASFGFCSAHISGSVMAGLAWGCSDKSLHLQVDQERTGQICPCRWQAEGLRHPASSASVGSFFTTFVWAMSRCVLVGHLVF